MPNADLADHRRVRIQLLDISREMISGEMLKRSCRWYRTCMTKVDIHIPATNTSPVTFKSQS